MSEISLGPDATLLVVDAQNDLVHPARAEARGVVSDLARAVRDGRVLDRIASLLENARAGGTRIVYTTFTNRDGTALSPLPFFAWARWERILREGTWGAEIASVVAPREGEAVRDRSTHLDPAADPELWSLVSGPRLVVSGVATNFQVEGIARAGAERGLGVTIVADACASFRAEWHRFAVEETLPHFADVQTTEALLGR